ncbi:OmpH family outer membrane protein [Cardinium endosymbiont of Culicoides punctatus]|uniref:OmpH family outer membrane protein n=1 Tax=Cardinium endosymbiont of Culicoides punctatus TaxID=2304601 RepID=UPI0010585474|nr:OmpH family outer membrane protein [Cardinium endosymbiont of Culicoides punctatus]TDG95682.1 hypothetical protein CCPUN_01450 [Cardinium endosymbiont of Culicoides punctatus]
MNYKFLCALGFATCTYVGTKADDATLVATHTDTAASALKIGYVDLRHVYNNLPEAQKKNAEMQSFQKQLENQLQSKLSDYHEKVENCRQQESTLTEAQKKQISLELNKLQSVIQELDEQKYIKIDRKYKEIIAPIQNRIQEAIHKISEQHNYSIVLNQAIDVSPIILFAQKSFDISELILEELKKEEAKQEVTPPVIGPQNQDSKTTAPKQKSSSKASTSAKKKK